MQKEALSLFIGLSATSAQNSLFVPYGWVQPSPIQRLPTEWWPLDHIACIV